MLGGGVGGDVDVLGAGVAAAVQPHHISNEPMSELSYAIYMARRLPVELLVQLVRRSFRYALLTMHSPLITTCTTLQCCCFNVKRSVSV
jgi:hypothetical protein